MNGNTNRASLRDWHEETWTALGIRALNGKRCSAWVDAVGHEMLYTDRSSYVVGGQYTVICRRLDEKIQVHTPIEASYTGQKAADPDQRARWEAESATAAIRLQRAARERKAKGSSELDVLLAPLVQYAARMRTQVQRDEFTAYVINRVARSAWR